MELVRTSADASTLPCRAMIAALDEVRTRSLERRRSSRQGVTPAAAAPRTRHPPGPALGPISEAGADSSAVASFLLGVSGPCQVRGMSAGSTGVRKKLGEFL